MQCTAYLSLYLALFVLFSHSAERRLHGHRGAGGGLWHDTTREEHETGQGPTPRRNQRLSTHENTSSTHTRNRAAPKGFGSATGVGGAGHKRGQGTYTGGTAPAHAHIHICTSSPPGLFTAPSPSLSLARNLATHAHTKRSLFHFARKGRCGHSSIGAGARLFWRREHGAGRLFPSFCVSSLAAAHGRYGGARTDSARCSSLTCREGVGAHETLSLKEARNQGGVCVCRADARRCGADLDLRFHATTL